MKKNTREIILKTAAEIMHRKGFNHTGIQEILNAAGVPKGSFYFYFKNKEELGLQVIDYFLEYYGQRARAMLDDRSTPPLERLRRFMDGFKDLFESMDYTCGCPVGNLAQEMGDISPAFRKKLTEAFEAMTSVYMKILNEAREAGDIPADPDPRELAEFIISSWHGALIRMKVEQSSRPLETVHRFIFDRILRS